MPHRCWRWRTRILLLMMSTNLASSEDVPLPSVAPLPPPSNLTIPKNQTAAAMAVGEVAANAAAAAGASPDSIIQTAAYKAGTVAAQDAEKLGMTQPQVEAAAAQTAEAAAKAMGATPEEAATTAGDLAVEVTKQEPAAGTAGVLTTNAWDIVPGTACLSWWGDGCQSITKEDACLSSRDGSEMAMTSQGHKAFGQPCVWCGGKPCLANSTEASVCAPLSMLPTILPLDFSTATCSGTGSATTGLTASALWQKSVPATWKQEELRGGGYPRRDLNFEPVFNPGDESREGGHACRGKSIEDASNPDPFSRNYYATWTADLKECLDICSWKQDCTGIEHSEKNNYCEVWNVPIEWVAPMDGYTCFRAMPATSNASAGAVRWRAGDTMAVEERAGSPVPPTFWVIGGLIILALVIAICVVWRSRRRKKKEKTTKRSVKTDDLLEQTASGDEMQPLVGAGTPTNGSSAPSFAGSFSNLGAGLGQNKTTPFTQNYSGYGGYRSDAGVSGYNYGYQAVDGGQGPPQPGDSNYLQQLREWLQQYDSKLHSEAARFQELAQLQSSTPQAGWGQTPAWGG